MLKPTRVGFFSQHDIASVCYMPRGMLGRYTSVFKMAKLVGINKKIWVKVQHLLQS